MNLVTILVGIAMLFAYIGILVWAINAWPFTTIVLFVFALLIYDLVRTTLFEKNGASG